VKRAPRGPALLIALLALAAAAPVVRTATEEDQRAATSALVEVTALRRGTLPRTTLVYGTMQPSNASRHLVMAPSAAVVAGITVRLGETVAKGAPLIRLNPTPTAAAAYAQAESAQRLASDLAARTRTMVGQHLATAQQLAAAEKAETDARASLAALKTQGAAGPNVLRTPFAATVTALSAGVGSIVAEGAPLLELARPAEVVLRAGVVPAVANEIAAGNVAEVTPLGRSGAFPARVLLRGAVVDAASGLVPIEIGLSHGALLPGETAVATVTTGMVPGFIVPHAAVLLDDEGHPYVVQAVGGVARKVAVRVLASHAEQDAIEGTLDPAAPLVLAGNYQLDNGMKVRIAPPAPVAPTPAPARKP